MPPLRGQNARSVTQKSLGCSSILGRAAGLIAACLVLGGGLAAGRAGAVDSPTPPLSAPAEATGSPSGTAVNFADRRLVLRLRERRVYLFAGDRLLVSYPVAIGRAGWETPTGSFTVRERIERPTWQHPFTHQLFPPGPNNPLGSRWIGFWTDGKNSVGFHGTPNPESIGRAASHGCVRMHDRDVIDLFDRITVGTPVVVEP